MRKNPLGMTWQVTHANPAMGHKWSSPKGFARCLKCGCQRKLEKKSGGYRTSYGVAHGGPKGGTAWQKSAPVCEASTASRGNPFSGPLVITHDGPDVVMTHHANPSLAGAFKPEPSPKTFQTPKGRTFRIRAAQWEQKPRFRGDDAVSKRYRILDRQGKEVGDILFSFKYDRKKPTYTGSAKGLVWTTPGFASDPEAYRHGGQDTGPAPTLAEALRQWGRSADYILDYGEKANPSRGRRNPAYRASFTASEDPKAVRRSLKSAGFTDLRVRGGKGAKKRAPGPYAVFVKAHMKGLMKERGLSAPEAMKEVGNLWRARGGVKSNPRSKTPELKFHKDGTVTYWSVFSNSWKRKDMSDIPDRELAAMSGIERAEIDRHILMRKIRGQ